MNQTEDWLSNDDLKVIVKNYKGIDYPIVDVKWKTIGETVRGFLGAHRILTLEIQTEAGNEFPSFFVKSLVDLSMGEFLITMQLFDKEVFAYQFIPRMKELVPEIDDRIIPKMYFYNPENETVVLENLCASGYVGKDSLYFEKEEMLCALKTLARFHACSIAYEERMSTDFGRKYKIIEDFKDILKPPYSRDQEDIGGKLIKSWVVGGQELLGLVFSGAHGDEDVKDICADRDGSKNDDQFVSFGNRDEDVVDIDVAEGVCSKNDAKHVGAAKDYKNDDKQLAYLENGDEDVKDLNAANDNYDKSENAKQLISLDNVNEDGNSLETSRENKDADNQPSLTGKDQHPGDFFDAAVPIYNDEDDKKFKTRRGDEDGSDHQLKDFTSAKTIYNKNVVRADDVEANLKARRGDDQLECFDHGNEDAKTLMDEQPTKLVLENADAQDIDHNRAHEDDGAEGTVFNSLKEKKSVDLYNSYGDKNVAPLKESERNTTENNYPTNITVLQKRMDDTAEDLLKLLYDDNGYRRVFSHGDIWGNNCVLKYDPDGKVIDCKIVDFQLHRYTPPAHDVTMIIYMASDRRTFYTNVNEYLCFYYRKLSEELARLNLNIDKILPLDEYEETCRICMPASKFLWLSYSEGNQLKPEVLNSINADPDLISAVHFGEKRADYVRMSFLEDPAYRKFLTDLTIDFRLANISKHISPEDCCYILNQTIKTDFELLDYTLANHKLEITAMIDDVVKLNYFVKPPPQSERVKKDLIHKETEFFSKIIPELQKHGITTDFAPKSYISKPRLLVLEDLDGRYGLEDYRKPLTLEYVKIGLKTIASLHAAGIAPGIELYRKYRNLFHPGNLLCTQWIRAAKLAAVAQIEFYFNEKATDNGFENFQRSFKEKIAIFEKYSESQKDCTKRVKSAMRKCSNNNIFQKRAVFENRASENFIKSPVFCVQKFLENSNEQPSTGLVNSCELTIKQTSAGLVGCNGGADEIKDQSSGGLNSQNGLDFEKSLESRAYKFPSVSNSHKLNEISQKSQLQQFLESDQENPQITQIHNSSEDYNKQTDAVFKESKSFNMHANISDGFRSLLKETIEKFPESDSNQPLEDFIRQVSEVFENIPNLALPSKTSQNTICHADLRTNNILYGRTDCKLVNFQSYRYAPPARDFLQYIYTCTDRAFRNQHLSECFSFYHNTLAKHLQDFGLHLSFPDFLKSCEEQMPLCLVQMLMYSQSLLAPEEFTLFENAEVFMDDMMASMKSDPVYYEKNLEAVLELKEYFQRVKEGHTGLPSRLYEAGKLNM